MKNKLLTVSLTLTLVAALTGPTGCNGKETSTDPNQHPMAAEDVEEHDAQGRVVKVSRDSNTDGVLDQIVTYDYDDQGRVVTEKVEHITENLPRNFKPRDFTETYAYEANPQLSTSTITETMDYDSDGTSDYVRTGVFDSEGRIILDKFQILTDIPRQEVGSARNYTETYVYGDRDTKRITDYESDGTSDVIHLTTHDGNGNTLTESFDDDADGTVDSITTYVYNADGHYEATYEDSDADGKPDRMYTPQGGYKDL
jgi:serralysin